MQARRIIWIAGLVISLSAPAIADGTPDAAPPAAAHSGKKSKKKHAKRQPVFTGWAVPASKLRTEPLPHPSGHLSLYNVNWRESLEVDLYNADGTMNEESLAALNHFWRCRRTGTEKPIEPHLFEVLSMIEDHYPGKQLQLISGFRNQKHTSSFHFHGAASDIRLPGVSEKDLRDFVATLDTGSMGLGLYPRGGFIHVDMRDEASYRWVDYSPPGSGEGGGKASHKSKKVHRNT